MSVVIPNNNPYVVQKETGLANALDVRNLIINCSGFWRDGG